MVKRLLALKIIAVIAALLVWLCLTRVGVRAAFADQMVTADARIGWIRFRAYPRLPKKEKAAKKKESKERKQDAAEAKPKSGRSLQEWAALVRSAVETLLPPLKRSLARIGRGIRIKPLQLYVTLGAAEDPAAGAQLYGEVNAAVWTVMPVLEELVDIREPYIQVDVDFDAAKTGLRGEAGISIRIGTLLAAAFGIGIPAMRWFLQLQKQQKNEEKQQPPAAPAAAGESVEQERI